MKEEEYTDVVILTKLRVMKNKNIIVFEKDKDFEHLDIIGERDNKILSLSFEDFVKVNQSYFEELANIVTKENFLNI